MPWTTPSLKDVRKLTRDFVTAQLGAKALIPNSVLRIMSDAQAALSHLTMLYIDWIARQMLPDTAETDWLDRHGAIWLLNSDGSKGRKMATYASGRINVTGTMGVILPMGTRFSYGVVVYQSTVEVELGNAATPVSVIALTAGPDGNIEIGERMSIIDAIVGVETVEALDVNGGAATETDDDLRQRILYRIQNPPMGGDSADFVIWATSVAGVTRAWCSPLEMGIGTVTVRFMMDELRSSGGGFPTQSDINTVKAAIDAARPVAVKDMFVVAPIPYHYDITISNLSNDTAAVRARIETAILKMERERLAPGSTLYRSWMDEAISGAIGEDHHELEFDTLTMPSPGHIPKLSTITYA